MGKKLELQPKQGQNDSSSQQILLQHQLPAPPPQQQQNQSSPWQSQNDQAQEGQLINDLIRLIPDFTNQSYHQQQQQQQHNQQHLQHNLYQDHSFPEAKQLSSLQPSSGGSIALHNASTAYHYQDITSSEPCNNPAYTTPTNPAATTVVMLMNNGIQSYGSNGNGNGKGNGTTTNGVCGGNCSNGCGGQNCYCGGNGGSVFCSYGSGGVHGGNGGVGDGGVGSCGGGSGGSISLSPAKTGQLKYDGMMDITSSNSSSSSSLFAAATAKINLNNGLEPCPKRSRSDSRPPVAAYPEREKLTSDSHQLTVDIPGTGPNLIVESVKTPREGENVSAVFTKMAHWMTLEFAHLPVMYPVNLRLFLVYSSDAEASSPVEPCKNHQEELHPKHMFKVRVGKSEAMVEWQDEGPHASVILTPTPQQQEPEQQQQQMLLSLPLVQTESHPLPLKYTCQLSFLCTNSCLKRKDLTLLCQLEEGGRVVAREPLRVKVSACPRRDAKSAVKRPASTISPQRNPSMQSPAPPLKIPRQSHHAPHQNIGVQEVVNVTEWDTGRAAREAESQGRWLTQLLFLNEYFKNTYPRVYKEACDHFSKITNID